MPRTPSDILKALIGEQAAQIAILQSQIETQQEQIEELMNQVHSGMTDKQTDKKD